MPAAASEVVQHNPLRSLASRRPPTTDRIAYYNLWFRGHNNRRSEELLRRLTRVDPYLYLCPERQPMRGLAYRSWRASRTHTDRLVFASLARRYRRLFTTDLEQVALFDGDVVVDLDDPRYTERAYELLARPNVRVCTVTSEQAAALYRSAGVATPIEVVPQGVDLASMTPERIVAVADVHRRQDKPVVGYVASWLLVKGDRGGDRPQFNVDHLFELWDEIGSAVPEAELWLCGNASRAVRAECAKRPSIRVLGRIPPSLVLSYIANFDVAVYPRTADHGPGIRALKIAEYVAVGVPIVAYDYPVTSLVRESGAGLPVSTSAEFVAATVRLLREPGERAELGARGRAAGASFSWDVLASRYDRLLDEYLPA